MRGPMRSAPRSGRSSSWPRIDLADLLLLAIPLVAVFPLRNNDLWWHLASGRLMVQTGGLPVGDPFSFTGFMGDWIDNQWLSQLIFYGVWRLGGNLGLVVLRAALYLVIFVQVRALLRRSRQPSAFLWAAVIGIALSYGWWELRPSVFSIVGSLAVLQVLERVRRTGRGYVALPIIFLIWASLHPGFLFGLCVLAGSVVAAFAERLLPDWRRWTIRPDVPRRLAVWSIVSFVATLANPYGWGAYTQQFEMARDTAFRGMLDEWVPPSTAFFVLVIVSVGSFLVLRYRRVSLGSLVPILGAAVLSTTGVRFIEYFALVSVPVMLSAAGPLRRWILGAVTAFALASVLVGLRPPLSAAAGEAQANLAAPDPAEARLEGRLARNALLLVAITGVALAASRLPLSRKLRRPWLRTNSNLGGAVCTLAVATAAGLAWGGSRSGALPLDLVEVGRYPTTCLAAIPRGSNVFARLSWGGWLVWNNDIKTFIDGRCWGQPIVHEYMGIRAPGGAHLLSDWPIAAVVLPRSDDLARQLRLSSSWELACGEGTAAVFLQRR